MTKKIFWGAACAGIMIAGIASAIGAKTAGTPSASTTLDPGHARYSTLTQITPKNVTDLKPVWVYDTGQRGRGWQVSPLVVDGVMYISQPGGAAALDPETGKAIWKFAPTNLGRPGRDRGVAYWPGDATHAPRVIYTISDRMYALDAATGQPIADFGAKGMINLRDEVADKYPNASYSISSPAGIYKNLAIIAPSTQEFGSKGPSGDPRAFDILTGKQVWRFHTVPQPGEPHSDSWGPNGWVDRAGPSAWAGVTVDPATGMAFLPIGNPDDSYNGIDRPGNNYYANSIVALDAATGKLKWFFQMTHHDINDTDASMAPSLIDIHKDGKVIPALVEVPKSGLAFILDRRTGKPVFGVEERPVPQSDLPGEHSSATQPFPVKPEPLVRTTISRDDLTTVSQSAHDYCVAEWDRMQMHSGGIYTPVSTKGTTVFMPGTSGGGNWGGVSTDPTRGYFFVNISDRPTYSRMAPDGAGGYRLQDAYQIFSDDKGWPCINPPWGELIAVNANTGDIAWRTPLGTADAYGGKNTGTTTMGGSAVTASGLIFIGATIDSRFHAFDSHTGKELWHTMLPAPGVATPLVYRGKSGREYVAIASGGPGTVQVPGQFASYHEILIAYALPKLGEAIADLAPYAPIEGQGGFGGGFGGGNRRGTPTAALPPSVTINGPDDLPNGPGKQDFVAMCNSCHGVSTAVATRRSPDGWHDLIQDMRSRGAPGDDAAAERVRDYLARYFGATTQPADAAPAASPTPAR
jgi:quinoprotein glucose dehydrogenase